MIAAHAACGRHERQSAETLIDRVLIDTVAGPALIGGVKSMAHKVALLDNGRCIGRVSYTENLDFWDGRNWTCGSTGHHLGIGKTRSGKFFLVHGTNWQNEHDYAEIVSEDEAKERVMKRGHDELYKQLFGEELPELD